MGLEGTRLSHYRLIDRLGEGGMGVVYRAHDERLQRDVAVKLLPPESLGQPEAHARLLREARLASALNHPNICTVFEAGDEAGQTFIVMELIDGRSLTQLTPSGGLAPPTVCRYGAQIADALDHAHRHGVVHRDLKLSNIMLTGEGRVKVVDFGLSRYGVEPRHAPAEAETTLTSSGMFVGTPLYLAPEVWRGGKADERSDIWALGIVLFELAAGHPPFAGATQYEIGAAVLNLEPEPLPDHVPTALAMLVRRCLEKAPEHRFRSAAEVRAGLEMLTTDAIRPAAKKPQPGRRTPIVAVAVAIVAVAGVFLAMRGARRPGPAGVPRLTQLTFNSPENGIAAAAISPDGRYLAFADRDGIQLRLIESGETRALTPPPGWRVEFPLPVPHLAWFPDGTRLLANSCDGMWIVPLQGGAPRKLPGGTCGGAVSPDGAWIAFAAGDSGEVLCRVAVNGGGPDTLVRVLGGASSPVWSPDGRRVAYLHAVRRPGSSPGEQVYSEEIWSFDIGTGVAAVLVADSLQSPFAGEHRLEWLADDRVVYQRDDTAHTRTVELGCVLAGRRNGRATGGPVNLTRFLDGVSGYPSANKDGRRLAFLHWVVQTDVFVAPLENGGRLGEPRRLTLDDRMDSFDCWTPDGSSLLFTSNRNGSGDIFVQSLDARFPRTVVAGPENEADARVSADGLTLSYSSAPITVAGRKPWPRRRLRVPLAGGTPEGIGDTIRVTTAQSRPSREIVIRQSVGDTLGVAVTLLVREGANRLRELAHADSIYSLVAFSPDSTIVAFVRGIDQGREPSHVTLMELASGATRRIGTGSQLRYQDVSWSADGRTLMGVAGLGDGKVIYRLPIAGKPEILWRDPDPIWCATPSPDGRHVAFTRATRTSNAWMLEGF